MSWNFGSVRFHKLPLSNEVAVSLLIEIQQKHPAATTLELIMARKQPETLMKISKKKWKRKEEKIPSLETMISRL